MKRRRGKKRRKLTAAQKRARRRRYHHRVVKTRRKKIRARLAAWRAARKPPYPSTHPRKPTSLFAKGQYVTMDNGKAAGVVEYVTSDGWVGIRETSSDGRSSVHEWPSGRVHISFSVD